MADSLFSDQFTVFRKSLNLHQQRLGVIANNVANADTPGYHAKRLEFEDSLRQAFQGGEETVSMAQTNPQHLGGGGNVAEVSPRTREVVQGGRVDGNTVNTQQELERLGETRLIYQVVSELTARRASGLKDAIQSGGK
jgi:flagellar basal-body rod protein FlgB